MMLFIISPATFLVIEMSIGRTSFPAASFSTIFPSYFPPSATYSPSTGPSSSLEDRKQCHPVLLFTITGRGMVISLSPIFVTCHP